MLVLTRYADEKIILRPTGPAKIVIQVQSIHEKKVRLGIDAPQSVRIDREEVDKARHPTPTPTPLTESLRSIVNEYEADCEAENCQETGYYMIQVAAALRREEVTRAKDHLPNEGSSQ